jgi:hypothetical protein
VGNQIWWAKIKSQDENNAHMKKKKKKGVEQGVMSMHALHLYGL